MNKPLRILVIDDEESVRKVFRNALSMRPNKADDIKKLEAKLFQNNAGSQGNHSTYEMVEASRAEDGVEMVRQARQQGRPFCIAFIDVRLPPGPHGVWAAEEIRRLDPDIQIVIVTAYSDFDVDEIMRAVPPSDKLLFILKPFHPLEIRQFATALSSKWMAEHDLKVIQAGLEQTVESQQNDLVLLNEQLRADIARRVEVEAELTRHEHVFQTMDEAVIITDKDGIIRDCNPAFFEMFGLSKEQAVGTPIDNHLLHSGTPAMLRQKTRESGTWRGELGFIGKQGPNGYALGAIKQLESEAGYLYILLDISERKQVLSAYVQSRETLQYVFDHIDEGIVIFDDNLVHLSVNLSYCRLMEEDRKALIGKNLLPFLTEESRRMVKEQVQLRRQNRHSTYELEFITRKGRKRFLKVSAYPRFNESNQFIGSFSVVTDVTEQKNLQDQLLQTQKMETLGAMAGGVAHDFNNLLTIIGGAAELLKMMTEEQKQRRFVEEIEKAVGSARGIVSQLLVFSRKQEIKFNNLLLNDVIMETLLMLKRILGSNIKTSLSPSLPAITGNADMFRQILLNLVINARDAMPQGGDIIIQTQLLDPLAPACTSQDIFHSSCIHLSVRDTGTGMDEETRARAFEPFYTTKDEGKGTGLGLSTVYEIVKRHKGWVALESTPGKGTEFNLYFPAANRSPEDSK